MSLGESGWRPTWHDDGLLHIRGALDPLEVATVLDTVDGALVEGKEEKSSLRVQNAIARSSELDHLLDHSNLLPCMTQVAGSYIRLLASDIFARYESQDDIHSLHIDGGPSFWGMAFNPDSPCISFRVQYFLTDVATTDSGNFMYVPGSHRIRPPALVDDELKLPEWASSKAVQLVARAGDAVIFPWALWHGVSRNLTGTVRKSVILRFGQYWVQPNDYVRLAAERLNQMTARQKRLCGDIGPDPDPMYYYYPPGQVSIMSPID